MWLGLEGRGLPKKKRTQKTINASIGRASRGCTGEGDKSIDRASKQVGHGRHNSERAASASGWRGSGQADTGNTKRAKRGANAAVLCAHGGAGPSSPSFAAPPLASPPPAAPPPATPRGDALSVARRCAHTAVLILLRRRSPCRLTPCRRSPRRPSARGHSEAASLHVAGVCRVHPQCRRRQPRPAGSDRRTRSGLAKKRYFFSGIRDLKNS